MKDFKKYYTILAPIDDVYMALTNANSISLWTDEDAVMSTEPGSEFSLWGGNIVGKNIEFEENKKIVQQWYFDGQEEESIVTILLHTIKQGTTVELKHSNIPDADFNEFVDGWNDNYFAALKDFFE
jgi:activator of HSP90 ATPase